MDELNELNRIRLEEDLTYGALAEQIGLSESNLSRALRRKNALRDRSLHKIRAYLKQRKSGSSRKGQHV